jgi:fatty acid desaturase
VELLSPAIVLLLLCVLMSALYTYRLEKERRQSKLLFVAAVMFFVAGVVMLFITAGWKWGLVGLGISWLTVMVVSLAITAAFRVKKYVDPLLIKRVYEVDSIKTRLAERTITIESRRTPRNDICNSQERYQTGIHGGIYERQRLDIARAFN